MAGKPKLTDADFAAELVRAGNTGDWVPTASELDHATPDEKRFFLVEAAQDLMSGNPLANAVAEFVGDLVLARCSLKGLRTAAKRLQLGQMIERQTAYRIAAWILTVKFQGRPSADRSKELRIAADFFRRKHQDNSQSSIVAALAQEYRCTSDYVRKCRNRYASLDAFDDDLLAHLTLQGRSREPATEPQKPSAIALDLAQSFLSDSLASGPVRAVDIYRNGLDKGYSKRTLDRAKKVLKVKSKRHGRQWLWTLPSRLPNS